MDGASGRIAVQPKTAAMGLDDRSAQRQSDAQTLGLGGGEWQERVGDKIRRESGTRIADSDLDEIVAGKRRLDRNRAAPALADRLHGIAQQIQQSLLDLQHIRHDRRQIGGDDGAGGHLDSIEIVPAQIDGLLDDMFVTAGGAAAAVKANQGAQTAYYFGGALDLRHRLPRSLRYGSGVRSAGAHGVIDQSRIGAGGHQRLGQLVRYGGGELAHA